MINQIIKMIMELKWYQVLVIAIVDDAILFIKMWWIFIPLLIFLIIVGILRGRIKI